jgi:hypothetical protein
MLWTPSLVPNADRQERNKTIGTRGGLDDAVLDPNNRAHCSRQDDNGRGGIPLAWMRARKLVKRC